MDDLWDNPSMHEQPTEQADTATCWRCGKQIPAASARCPLCAAPQKGSEPPASSAVATSPESRRVVWVVVSFAIMVLTSAVLGIALQVRAAAGGIEPELSASEVLKWTGVAELIDTVLVLVVLARIAIPRPADRPSASRRAAAWLLFPVPILGGMLALNFAYHEWLREAIGLEVLEMPMGKDASLLPWWIVAVCIQPAVIEELFFRYIALGTLRSLCGVHTAVLVTSIMFTMAHIGAPLSMPILFLLGMVLGYARTASASLALPIVIHFLHNGVVLVAEIGRFPLV